MVCVVSCPAKIMERFEQQNRWSTKAETRSTLGGCVREVVTAQPKVEFWSERSAMGSGCRLQKCSSGKGVKDLIFVNNPGIKFSSVIQFSG